VKQPVAVNVPVTVYTVNALGLAYTVAALVPAVYGIVAAQSRNKLVTGDQV
jgi:hypothetical protein